MKLRHKIFLILTVGISTLIALLYGIVHHNVHDRFAMLERVTAEKHLERVENAQNDRGRQLNYLLTDWCAWDETRAFVLGQGPDYIAQNLDGSFLVDQQLHLVAFFDQAGRCVESFFRADADGSSTPLTAEQLAAIQAYPQIFGMKDAKDSLAGLIRIGSTVFEVAAQPISGNEHEGPTYGTMMIGRRCSEAGVRELGALTQLSIERYDLTQALPPGATAAVARLSAGNPLTKYIKPLGPDALAAYRVQSDVAGTPTMLIQVNVPRTMMAEAEGLLRFVLFAMVLLGVCALGMLYFGLNHQVLGRMLKITEQLKQLNETEVEGAKLTLSGCDELHELATSLDEALQQASSLGKDFAHMFEFSPDMIALIGFDGRFQRINPHVESSLGYTLASLGDQTFESFQNPEDQTWEWAEAVQAVDEEVVLFEGRFLTAAQDEERWVNWHLRFRPSEQLVFAVGRDVTEEKLVSMALQQSEAHLNRIFENTNEAIFIADVQTRQMVRCNQAACDMLGYDRAALMTRRLNDFHTADTLKKVKRFIAQMIRGGGVGFRDDLQFITRDGRIIETEVSASRIDTEQGIQLVSVIRDISDRLAHERQQARTNLLLEKIRESQTEYIQEVEGPDLFRLMITDLIELTDSACGWFGEIMEVDGGKPYLNIRTVERRKDAHGAESFIQHSAQLSEVAMLDSLLGKVAHTGLAAWARHPEGDPMKYGIPESCGMLTSFVGLPLSKGGTAIGLIGLANRPGGYEERGIEFLQPYLRSCSNIIQAYRQEAKRREAEEALEREKLQRDSILHGIGDGVVVIDQGNNILLANHAAKDLLALPVELEDGRNWAFAVERLSVASGNGEELRNPEVYARMKVQLDIPTARVLDMVCTPFRDENRHTIGRILLFHDVTRETEIDRMKTEFVSSVSHELRTPLASIKGFTSTILNDDSMELATRREFLGIIDEESDRLTALIVDILDISKMEAGAMDWNVVPLCLPSAIMDMCKLLRPQFETKGLALVYRGPERGDIAADRIKLTQLLQNLIGNGLKYSDTGQVTIELDDHLQKLTISDTGLGIPENDLPYIFDRFYQVQRKGSTAPGAGLGLTLVKAIAEGHGWSIDVASAPGKGTSFFIGLAAAKIPNRSTVKMGQLG